MPERIAPAPIKKFFSKKGMFDDGTERAMCTLCGLVMRDQEPGSNVPEFNHKVRGCANDGQEFRGYELGLTPFMRKRDRRAGARIMKTR